MALTNLVIRKQIIELKDQIHLQQKKLVGWELRVKLNFAISTQFLWRSKCHMVGYATEVSIQVVQPVRIVNTTVPEFRNYVFSFS
jgi:hypothetical protein